MKSLKEKIEDRIATLPDGQVTCGVYVVKIGRNRVRIIYSPEIPDESCLSLKDFARLFMPDLLEDGE